MSTENDKLPNDKNLSSIYKETAQDIPAAHIDDAIIAAARRETASRPRPAFSPFSGSWRMPAAVAAVIVLSFSLVTLMENDVMPIDGLAPPTVEEAELLQSPAFMADKDVTREEKRELAKAAPRKPAMKSRDEVASAPGQSLLAEQARKRVLSEAERKKKQQVTAAVAESIATPQAVPPAAPALTSRLLTVPSVGLIQALRLEGDIKQANQVADDFMKLHFGDDLTTLEPGHLKLPVEQWTAFIIELRELDRIKQAERLQMLLDQL